MGVPLGSSNVHRRHGHSLVTDELETALPSGVQRHASLADGNRSMSRHHRHLPVRHRRYATLYLFPVLV